MATKTAAPTEVEVTESTPFAEIIKRPDTIKLFGHFQSVMDEYTIHARNGYRVFPGVLPRFFEFNGNMSLLLQLGDPAPLASQRAAESMAQAQKEEAAEFDRRVTAEAKRFAAEQAQRDLQARVDAAQAVADAQVQRIREDAEAAIARIVANV
jgi:hypothetical protein